MKKTIKHSLVVAAMLGVITGYANLDPSVSLVNDDSSNITLSLDHLREGQRLIIKSKKGVIVYKEEILKSGLYEKEFDLTALPNGEYYFELDQDFEIKIMPFTVINSEVNFSKDAQKSIFKPVITVKDNTLRVGKLSLDLEPMSIHIYFDSGDYELIYSEEITDTKNIQRVYALLKEVKGNYKVVCKTEGRVFTNYFKV